MIVPTKLKLAPMVLLLGMLMSPAWAQGALYAGQGDLDPDSPDLDAALIQALDEVLLRLTGQVDGQIRQQLGLGVADVRELIQSQQRIRVRQIDDRGEAVEEVRLQVQFTPDALNRRLADAAIPSWGRERPSLLLWVATEDQSSLRLAAEPEVELQLIEQGRRLGLTVLRPLGDLLDLAEIQAAEVRGGFLDASETALQRYQADVPVMLDLRQESEQDWTARWFWRLEGRDQSVALQGDDSDELIVRGMEAIFASLANRYAVAPDDLGLRRQTVVIRAIEDRVQYAEVLRHLEGLSMVDAVRVLSARGLEVTIELTLVSGGLVDALELGGLLELGSTLPDGRLALMLTR